MRIANGDLSLNLVEGGDPQAPPVLILHGIIGSKATWDWLVPDLAERFRVLRLDFRGHGESDRAPDQYSATGYASDAIAALEAIGQPCLIVGHSLGGVTAAAITQQRPELLTAAILEDPPLGPTTSGEALSLEGNTLLDAFKFMREAIPQMQEAGMTIDSLAEVIATTPHSSGNGTFGDVMLPEGIRTMAIALLQVDATVLDPVLNGMTGAFLDPTVPFGVPTLIVAADPTKPDAVASPASCAHYASISPDVEIVVADGAGHTIHNEFAGREPFRAALLDFIARH